MGMESPDSDWLVGLLAEAARQPGRAGLVGDDEERMSVALAGVSHLRVPRQRGITIIFIANNTRNYWTKGLFSSLNGY